VQPLDWKHFKLYDRFVKISERALRATDAVWAPWTLVEATDNRYRELMVGGTLLAAIKRRLSEGPVASDPGPVPFRLEGTTAGRTVLDGVDLAQRLTDTEYQKRLPRLQARLSKLAHAAWEKKRSSVVMFEGWDAAGKGGCIRRLTEAMDARAYRVIPVAAPTDEERSHHYLWRFWRHIPRAGAMTIYDRSWYGRVLVERVEGFAPERDWARAYREINDFEEQLLEHGVMLTKLWLHLGKDEQLRRFEDRQSTAYKQHKITDEDWRNREKWDAYAMAVAEMVERTSTPDAPWTLVAGNDKKFARIQVLETVCARLERAL
jgi:polyphosphate:AMP phosphotransferase